MRAGTSPCEDELILSYAAERDYLVRGLRRPSVIRLRRGGCWAEAVVAAPTAVLANYQADLRAGVLFP